MRTFLPIAMVAAITSLGIAEEPTAEGVHKQALGKWADTYEEEGNSYRLVKDIGQDTETFSVYEDDELVQQWVVKFKIEIINGLSNFTFWDGRLTVGDRKGDVIFNKPRTYVFKIHEDKWYEAGSMVVTDQHEPFLRVYKRVK